jgi:hypothetical protein
MQHFYDILRSEGFAWGAFFGLGISIALDLFISYARNGE